MVDLEMRRDELIPVKTLRSFVYSASNLTIANGIRHRNLSVGVFAIQVLFKGRASLGQRIRTITKGIAVPLRQYMASFGSEN